MKHAQLKIFAAAALLGGLGAVAHAQGVLYRGLTHSPLGSAILTVDPNDTLLVGNLGSGGLDGVTIDLGSSEYWDGQLRDLPTTAPSGAFFELTARGVPAGLSYQTLSEIRFDKVGPEYWLSADFPFIGSPALNVTVLNGETPVSAAFGLTGPLVILLGTGEHRYDPARAANGRVTATIAFTNPIDIAITGQPLVIGDKIVISAVDPTTIDSVNDAELRAAGLGSFRVSDEKIGKFGFAHRALGQATLNASGVCPSCALTLGNIGSTGDDGVRVEVDGADGFDIEWTPFSAGAPNGSFISLSADGSVGGSIQNIGSAKVKDIGATLEFTADLSPIGAISKTVEAYSGGVLVGSATGITAPVVATVDDLDWPAGGGAHARISSGFLPGWRYVWDSNVPIDLFGGPIVTADVLLIVGENPGSGVDSITTINDTGSDIPDLELTDEDADPLCPGDLDGDNNIGLSDLAMLLANYGQMNGANYSDGDLDSDGDVDLADLAALLADYGAPC